MTDTYRRRFESNVAQCGCKWVGPQLVECTFHAQATKASVRKFEKERRPCVCGCGR